MSYKKVLVDFHCHLYPVYDLRKAILFARERWPEETALFLTERSDCSYFEELASGSSGLRETLKIVRVDSCCLQVEHRIFLFSGRQYAAAEGIEVLSLFSAQRFEDKKPAEFYCEEIIKSGGIIAFSWAFGKWRGQRSTLIKSLAEKFGPERVVLLDSGIRPQLLPLPATFRELSAAGFRVFTGSDPLPIVAHQSRLASFVSRFDLRDDGTEVGSTFIRGLLSGSAVSAVQGKRSSLFAFIKDQLTLRSGLSKA